MAFTAVLDACVLYPAPLRDLLLHLGIAGIFRPRWSDAIHDEWVQALLRTRPELAQKLDRTRTLMNEAVPDGLVTGHEALIPALILPDDNDRHVLAAAIRCSADVIITFNLRDFPRSALAPFEIDAQHPDVFLCHAIDFDSAVALGAIKRLRAGLRSPPKTAEDYIDTLLSQGLPTTADALKPWAALI